jgi:hypothetical protein
MRPIRGHTACITIGLLSSVSVLAAMSLPRPAAAADLDVPEFTVPAQNFKVDCGEPGQSITRALTLAHGQDITFTVSGTCTENVVINQPNVTLRTTTGAVIKPADATKVTVAVLADGATVDGFTITSGFIGYTANGALRLKLVNSTVENNNRGVQINQGASVVIDHCVVRNNQFGITAVTNASYNLTNSTITNNAFTGVQLGFDSSATIGVTQAGVPGPNTISNNGASGIQIVGGSFAGIDNNIISNNGSNVGSAFDLDGISISEAGANIGGGNTISNNGQFGIELRDANAIIGRGNAEPNSAPTDVITGNGTNPAAGPGGGIFASASHILVTGETVTKNNGPGVALAVGSGMKIQAQVPGVTLTVTGNAGDGIQVAGGSRFFGEEAGLTVNVSGNGGFDLNCLGNQTAIDGQFAGFAKISPNCTGF